MRLLCINGKFGYKKEKIFEGLIVFCHFESPSDAKKLIKAAKRLLSTQPKAITLVPFVHLGEEALEKGEAKKLFDEFVLRVSGISKIPIRTAPFGTKKEFYLYAPADDAAISFKHF